MAELKRIPKLGRHFYRSGNDFKGSTFGLFPGFLQTNVAILPSNVASDFEEFCRKNSAPLPILYQSKPGEIGTTLAEDSNIQTDISTYQKYENGVPNEQASVNLLGEDSWDDMVTFHLGCSYSFDHKLTSSGVKLGSGNVAAFETNVRCVPVGPFDCNMAVSMRSIPRELLSKVVSLSVDMDFAHGAPIHIGDPSQLGINSDDSGKLISDLGYDGFVREGEVPCFWACGVTGNLALRSAGLPISYSHHPGSMFVTDITSKDAEEMFQFPRYPDPQVLCLDEMWQRYAIVSKSTLSKLQSLELVVAENDPGNRGISQLRIPSDFPAAVLDISLHASFVGILVGFPVNEGYDPCEENDGIAGAVYLIRALQEIGVKVTVLIDETAKVLHKFFSECSSRNYVHENVLVQPIGSHVEGLTDITHGNGVIKFSHLIAIERPSPAENGSYYTMTGRDISDKVGAMGEIFRAAQLHPKITTIGIGDGGNELGMGKVKDRVKEYITHGETIAANVSCDYLITCGVSNWGGAALAAGLFTVRQCPVHDRYRRKGISFSRNPIESNFLFDSQSELALHEWITELGFRDGVTGQKELTVDGLDFNKHHAPISQKLKEISKQHEPSKTLF